MKSRKSKKKFNVIKLIAFLAGAVAALAAVGAVLAVMKKKIDEQKKREAEIEAEITEIIERKFAEAAQEDAEAEEK